PISTEVIDNMQSSCANPDSYPVDGRAVSYSMAFFCPKHRGKGSFYLLSIKDKHGKHFQGNTTYRLNVPPNVPVTQYWSATVYDRHTHGFIRNVSHAGRSSQAPGLEKNADG